MAYYFVVFTFFFFSVFFLGEAQPSNSLFGNANFFGAKNFTSFLTKASMEKRLKDPGNLTLFAPLDAAFGSLPSDIAAKLQNDPAFLKQVLSYHVVNGRFIEPSLSNDQLLPTDDNVNVRFNRYTNAGSTTITASGSTIKLVNIPSNNGYLYIVNKVIYPVPTGTALDYITTTSTFSTFLLALSRAAETQIFTGGSLTLFAPSDAAFSRLPAGVLDNLLDNVTQLQEVIKMHLVDTGTMYSVGLNAGDTLTSESGLQLDITRDNNALQVNGIKVSVEDVTVDNGVVHTIDDVLLPPSLPLTYR